MKIISKLPILKSQKPHDWFSFLLDAFKKIYKEYILNKLYTELWNTMQMPLKTNKHNNFATRISVQIGKMKFVQSDRTYFS